MKCDLKDALKKRISFALHVQAMPLVMQLVKLGILINEDADYFFTEIAPTYKREESEENRANIKAIQNDDLEALQQIASSPLFDINMKIRSKNRYIIN